MPNCYLVTTSLVLPYSDTRCNSSLPTWFFWDKRCSCLPLIPLQKLHYHPLTSGFYLQHRATGPRLSSQTHHWQKHMQWYLHPLISAHRTFLEIRAGASNWNKNTVLTRCWVDIDQSTTTQLNMQMIRQLREAIALQKDNIVVILKLNIKKEYEAAKANVWIIWELFIASGKNLHGLSLYIVAFHRIPAGRCESTRYSEENYLSKE